MAGRSQRIAHSTQHSNGVDVDEVVDRSEGIVSGGIACTTRSSFSPAHHPYEVEDNDVEY